VVLVYIQIAIAFEFKIEGSMRVNNSSM